LFVRGSGAGVEASRVDNGFYRGIVVKNNDPLLTNRVKVYIPELTNQPYDEWWEKFDNINVNTPGKNIKSDNWSDTKMFEEISKLIPWAEQCAPLFGESGNFRYYKDGEISTISDCNYPEGFEIINTDYPTLSGGSFAPAFLYEHSSTVLGDAFNTPLSNFTVKCNPYSFSYRPSKHVNKSKGINGVPEVGAKVWVFHYEGDLNFPIYFGVVGPSVRSNLIMIDGDNDKKISPSGIHNFES
jgi:hypothetical protein